MAVVVFTLLEIDGIARVQARGKIQARCPPDRRRENEGLVVLGDCDGDWEKGVVGVR